MAIVIAIAVIFAFSLLMSLLKIIPFIAMSLLGAIIFCSVSFFYRRSKLRRLRRQRYLDDIAGFQWRDDIDPIEFERRCAEAFRLAGWSANLTKGSGDQGADVVAERNNYRIVVQCKRYSKAVGNKAVQEAFAAQSIYKANSSAVVTNQIYTRAAHELSKSTGVHLLHFTDLSNPNKVFGVGEPTPIFYNSGVTQREIDQLSSASISNKAKIISIVSVVSGIFIQIGFQGTHPDSFNARGVWGTPQARLDSNNLGNTAMPHNADPPRNANGVNVQAPTVNRNNPVKFDDHIATKSEHSKPELLLQNGSHFCQSEYEFDELQNFKESKPYIINTLKSCSTIMNSGHDVYSVIINRKSTNKSQVKITTGALKGRDGYTDSFLP